MESNITSPGTHVLGNPRTGIELGVGDAAVVGRRKAGTLILGWPYCHFFLLSSNTIAEDHLWKLAADSTVKIFLVNTHLLSLEPKVEKMEGKMLIVTRESNIFPRLLGP